MEQKENNKQEGTQKRTVPVESIAQNMKERMNRLGMLGEEPKRGALMVIDDWPPVGDNTTIMLHLMNELAVKGRIPAAYFSTELPNVQVVNRLISIITGIGQKAIADGTLSDEEWEKLDAKIPELTSAPLYVDDTYMPTLTELDEKIATLAREHGVRLVVVNPINEISAIGYDAPGERFRLDYIIESLRATAEEYGITVFAVEE